MERKSPARQGPPARRFDAGEAVVPGLALVFALAFFLQTTDAPAKTMVWPFITAAICLVLWLPIVITYVWRRGGGDRPRPKAGGLRVRGARPALVLSAVVGYLLVLPWLGFTLDNFVFMLALSRGLGGRRWGVNLAVAAGLALFLHLALVVFLQLEVPRLHLGGLEL